MHWSTARKQLHLLFCTQKLSESSLQKKSWKKKATQHHHHLTAVVLESLQRGNKIQAYGYKTKSSLCTHLSSTFILLGQSIRKKDYYLIVQAVLSTPRPSNSNNKQKPNNIKTLLWLEWKSVLYPLLPSLFTTLQGALKFLLHNTAKFGCSSDIVILLQILGEIQLQFCHEF